MNKRLVGVFVAGLACGLTPLLFRSQSEVEAQTVPTGTTRVTGIYSVKDAAGIADANKALKASVNSVVLVTQESYVVIGSR